MCFVKLMNLESKVCMDMGHMKKETAKVSFMLIELFELCVPLGLDGSLSGSQTGDGYTEGGAGYVIQTDLVAELNGGRIAAVLAADAQMDVGTGAAAQFCSHAYQTAYTMYVQLGEGVKLVDLVVVVGIQELASVITAEAEGHLG